MPIDVATALKDVSSADAKVRLKASKQLESELRKAASPQRKSQFGNKAVTTRLISLLDDPDPKVVHNCVVSLAQITRHYFQDAEAYPKLLGLVHSKHPLTTRWVIDALIHLGGESSLKDLMPLCTDSSQEARAMVFLHFYSWLVQRGMAGSVSIQAKNRVRLKDAALKALSDEDQMVRGNAVYLLSEVGDASVLPVLRKALKKENYWLTKQAIADAIKKLEG